MHRRHQLRPDTFPFLAVLLCAMGSLILVLLELDRRARSAAHDRAEQAWKDSQKEKAELLARLRSKRHAERASLREQAQGVLAERARVQEQLEEILRSLQAERAQQAAGEKRRAEESARVDQARHDLAAREQQLGQARRRVEAARSQRERLTGDLLLLEQAMARLKEQRAQAGKEWSLVPYVGKRGLNRQPLYVECAARRIVFHPDHRSLNGFTLSAENVLAEVTKRMKGRPDPYWMLLVRPDGILSYYQFLQATRGLDIAYGYEFVDAGWDFDFPAPANAPEPVEVAAPLPTPTRRVESSAVIGTRPGTSFPQPLPRGPEVEAREGEATPAPGAGQSGFAAGGPPGVESLFPNRGVEPGR